jgi:hypothetical protein
MKINFLAIDLGSNVPKAVLKRWVPGLLSMAASKYEHDHRHPTLLGGCSTYQGGVLLQVCGSSKLLAVMRRQWKVVFAQARTLELDRPSEVISSRISQRLSLHS